MLFERIFPMVIITYSSAGWMGHHSASFYESALVILIVVLTIYRKHKYCYEPYSEKNGCVVVLIDQGLTVMNGGGGGGGGGWRECVATLSI